MRLAIEKRDDLFTVAELESFLKAARAVGATDETLVYLPDLNSDELSIEL